jgi:hypothetical protein
MAAAALHVVGLLAHLEHPDELPPSNSHHVIVVMKHSIKSLNWEIYQYLYWKKNEELFYF